MAETPSDESKDEVVPLSSPDLKIEQAEEAVTIETNQQPDEEVYRVPVLGTKESTMKLLGEYDPDTSPEFFNKLLDITQRYGTIRHIRGDGACWWRCLVISLFEKCSYDVDYCKRVKEICKVATKKLVEQGYESFAIDDFIGALEEAMDKMIQNKKSDVYKQVADANYHMYYVYAIKFLTIAYILENRSEYEDTAIAFECSSLKEYLEKKIQVTDAYADDIGIYASCLALELNIRVEYVNCDNRPMNQKGSYHLIPKDDETLDYSIFFLWRPEHYDILYKGESEEDVFHPYSTSQKEKRT